MMSPYINSSSLHHFISLIACYITIVTSEPTIQSYQYITTVTLFTRTQSLTLSLSWLGKTAKLLFIFLFFSFSFLLSWTYYTEGSAGKCYITSVTVSQSHDRKSQHHITWCHMIGHMIGMGKKCTDHVVVV